MSIGPDLAGFEDAQQRLIAQFGRDVRFYAPADDTYDPTIPADEFDLEGIPLDPTVAPLTTDAVDVAVANLKVVGVARGSVVFQPLAPTVLRSGEFQETQQGLRSRLNMAVTLNIADKPTAENASHFQLGTTQGDGTWIADDDQLWRIIQGQADGLGSAQRYLVTGETIE